MTAIQLVVDACLRAAEQHPPETRADLYDGLAELICTHDGETALAAKKAAHAIREAAAAQLVLKSILSQSIQ